MSRECETQNQTRSRIGDAQPLLGIGEAQLDLADVAAGAASGAAPAGDGENAYVSTGNGDFDAQRGGRDFGDSIIKLGMGRSGALAMTEHALAKPLARASAALGG